MTLALYGKSKRRQGGLILAGFVALLLAIISGVALDRSGTPERVFAHGEDSPSECKASGVGELDVADSATEGVINAGPGKVVDWLCIKSGNDAFGDEKHSQKITTDGSYGNGGCFIVEGLGTATAKVKEKGTAGCKDISHIDYKLKDAPKVDLKVCKNYEGNSSGWLKFVIQTSWDDTNKSFDAWVKKDSRTSCKEYEVPAGVDITIEETSFPSGWNNAAGYPKYDLDPGADGSLGDSDTDGKPDVVIQVEAGSCILGGSQASATSTQSGPDCKVTITNKYAPPQPKLEIEKKSQGEGPYGLDDTFYWDVIFTTSVAEQDDDRDFVDVLPSNFEVTGISVDDGPDDALSCVENPANTVKCELEEGAGHPDGNERDYKVRIFVKVISVDQCNLVTNQVKEGATVVAEDTVSIECAQVVLPGVKKVAVAAPDNMDGTYAYWDIVITPAGADSPAFEDLQIVDFYSDIAIASQNPSGACTLNAATLTCDVPAGAGPVTVRVKREIAPVVQDTCLGGSIDNKLVSASYGQDPITISEGTSPIAYTVDGVASECGKPSISKTVTNGAPNSPLTTTNPSDVSWTVEVVNPAAGTGVQKTVVIKDSGVVVTDGPHYTNANCTIPDGSSFQAELTSANGVTCTMGGNPQSKIVFGVQPATIPARACADQHFNNTATITFDQTTLEGVGPKITLEKDLTNCTVNVTFSKYICQEYSDVPRNEGPGGQNDIGKNDGPAGLDADNLGAKGPADNDAAVNLGNDGEGPSCALATTPWTFNIFTTNRVNGSGGTLLQTFAITGSQEITLNANALAETLKGSGAYIEEEYQAGYGFGALKCYTDHLNDDNWEWLNFQSGIPTGAVHCIAYNVPATRDLQICKVVVGNGDGIVDGGVFKFDITGKPSIELIAYEPAGDENNDTNGTAVCQTVKVGIGPVTVTEWTARPPTYGWEGSWNGDDPLFPQNDVYGLGSMKETANVPADVNKVTFYNKTLPRERTIIIEKYFLGDFTEADYPTFVFTEPEITPECTVDASQSPKVVWTCKVPADWNGDINEIPAANWQQVTGEDCPPLEPQNPTFALTQAQETSDLRRLWTFCNQPVGTVVVIKYENIFPAAAKNWTIDGTLPAPPFVLQTNGTGQVGGTDSDSETFSNVPVGSYSLAELLGRGACAEGSTSTDFETRGLFRIGGGLPTANELNAANIISNGSQDFTVEKGATTYVAFGNIGCGLVLSGQQMEVTKYLDLLGNFSGTTPLAGWTITATGIGGAATGDVLQPEVTNGAGKAFFLGIDDGTYEVCETPQAGYDVIGSRYDGSTQSGACRTVVVLLGETTEVDFYNQPRLNIEVTKTIFNNANPVGANGGAGWTFTLSGCGVGPLQQTTGDSGKVAWTDLAPAVNCSYTVTETQKAGWIADQISKSTSAQGGTVTFTFINRQFQGCTNINDCGPVTVCDDCNPTPTPTNTPVTPTNTPDPDETPTEEPTATPTTPITDVEGEKTPGPGQPTPIAPDTGVGIGGTSAGMNVLLVIAGLIAISGGLSFIALGRRKS